uniref:Uncharacterized protein n=1 Tax=Anguilla anguilla TaxID=7936 RepID=A0A0E9PXM9_ANGAN
MFIIQCLKLFENSAGCILTMQCSCIIHSRRLQINSTLEPELKE